VLRHGADLGLSASILKQIQSDLIATRKKVQELETQKKKQWDDLASAIANSQTDVNAILAKVDVVSATENQIWKLNVALTVRTRRALTAEQLKKLDSLVGNQSHD
jgi:hypothetical protein